MKAFVLDAHAYHALPPQVRDQMDAWLAEEGINPKHLWGMSPGEGCVRLYVYRTTDEGRHYVDPETGEVAMVTFELPVRRPPPREAFGL